MSAIVNIKDREYMTLSGVSEVLGFEEDYICVMTEAGKLEIEGSGLKITNMSADSGEMAVLGHIDGFFYSVKSEKKSLFKKK